MAAWPRALLIASISLFVAGCGGDAQPPSVADGVTGAPNLSGDTATDGLAWFNFRRQQAGLPQVARNSHLDAAAQAHSDYLKNNHTISHTEESGKDGFTGVTLYDRIVAAGYPLDISVGYLYGEVISSTDYHLGENAAEELIGAIYHRFVIMEPLYKEAGAGSATTSSSTTYFTVDFASQGFTGGITPGTIAVYPYDGQSDVPLKVNSDDEEPDPASGQNEIGYPVSVHANENTAVNITTFWVKELASGAALSANTLANSSDANTPVSAAALIPLSTLKAGTTYQAYFKGTVTVGLDPKPVEKTWNFTTKR